MLKVTRLIHLASGLDPVRVERFTAQLRQALTGAERHLVEPTLAGSRNGGDILLHAQFRTEACWFEAQPHLDALLAGVQVVHVDGVDYRPKSAASVTSHGSVYRTLLVAVAPETPDALIEAFEADLLLMPRFVHTIAAYQLSRPERTLGAARWTHIFEQEFTDEAGLMGAYLMHPIHWARVDRWFDPECPEFIVRERICHSYCRTATPVLDDSPG